MALLLACLLPAPHPAGLHANSFANIVSSRTYVTGRLRWKARLQTRASEFSWECLLASSAAAPHEWPRHPQAMSVKRPRMRSGLSACSCTSSLLASSNCCDGSCMRLPAQGSVLSQQNMKHTPVRHSLLPGRWGAAGRLRALAPTRRRRWRWDRPPAICVKDAPPVQRVVAVNQPVS